MSETTTDTVTRVAATIVAVTDLQRALQVYVALGDGRTSCR
ncbi:hypothetical protein O2V63_11865 [Modestobacter sp. VKM Ac-2977]|nr:hypothetical protein [Modestobacter sp. VKM Ac-2977]MCZ2821028.1 hypothetical protein [Modestobacter sp. VKM Ac-2977]